MKATDYGIDISCVSGLDPNFTLVTGVRVVAEALARRLTTARGSLFYAPDYGTDVREILNARIDQRRLDAWRTRIEAECRKDDRVDTVAAKLRFTASSSTLAIAVAGTLKGGVAFALTMEASQFDATLITVQELAGGGGAMLDFSLDALLA